MTMYVELQVTSHFSFLRGASSPDELFAAAALQGHGALGIVDRGSVAGLVRAWEAQKATGVRMIAGARVWGSAMPRLQSLRPPSASPLASGLCVLTAGGYTAPNLI